MDRGHARMTNEGGKPMDVNSSNGNGHDNTKSSDRNGFTVIPVEGGSSGIGLPYAPENWPRVGDNWKWKVGKRQSVKGFWLDRSLHPPKHFPNLPNKGFHSRLSLQQYIQKEFPDADADAFFASFAYKIPVAGYYPNEVPTKNLESMERPKNEATNGPGVCKAGNSICSLRAKSRTYALYTSSCDICCTESGFCRNCCCILCCKSIEYTYEGYSFIKCEAIVSDNFICGHVAHIDCALRAFMAGKVGGGFNLDTEYFCRRCDNKTDLLPHVTKLLKTCESIDSSDEVEKLLNFGSCILHGSERESAKDLENRIGEILDKL